MTLRLLFLCTGNSARSQMAEAILNAKGQNRFEVASAGSRPAARVNRYALDTLEEFKIPWAGHEPRSVNQLQHQQWDFVITVCDRAKEACPIFPGRPTFAHWSILDPADVEGTEAAKRAAFRDAFLDLSRRIDLLLALPALAPRSAIVK